MYQKNANIPSGVIFPKESRDCRKFLFRSVDKDSVPLYHSASLFGETASETS
jgi:hypothetical protein